jgi:hypothetical protein
MSTRKGIGADLVNVITPWAVVAGKGLHRLDGVDNFADFLPLGDSIDTTHAMITVGQPANSIQRNHTPALAAGQRGTLENVMIVSKTRHYWVFGILSLVIVSFLASPAWAWGRLGHRLPADFWQWRSIPARL